MTVFSFPVHIIHRYVIDIRYSTNATYVNQAIRPEKRIVSILLIPTLIMLGSYRW